MNVEMLFSFIVVFARITSFLFFVPFLKGSYIPSIAKIGIAMGISIFSMGMVPKYESENMYELVAVIFLNIFIGLAMAYFVEILFQAIQMAGALMDFDMGLSMAEVVDPANGTRKTVVAGLYQTLFVIVFIAVGGVQALLMNLIYTFQLTDPKGFIFNGSFIEMIITMITFMFAATLQIALPFMASIFIVNFVFLIIGRASPQMNIFANMFIVKMMLGIIFIILALPYLNDMFASYATVLNEKLQEAITVIYKGK